MEWYNVVFPDDIYPTPDDDARDMFQKCELPDGFAFYQKTTEDYRRVFYFNPVARTCCERHGLFESYKGRACDEPVDRGTLLVP